MTWSGHRDQWDALHGRLAKTGHIHMQRVADTYDCMVVANRAFDPA
jgi:hypothetical protein